jgi:hypothetical protein
VFNTYEVFGQDVSGRVVSCPSQFFRRLGKQMRNGGYLRKIDWPALHWDRGRLARPRGLPHPLTDRLQLYLSELAA